MERMCETVPTRQEILDNLHNSVQAPVRTSYASEAQSIIDKLIKNNKEERMMRRNVLGVTEHKVIHEILSLMEEINELTLNISNEEADIQQLQLQHPQIQITCRNRELKHQIQTLLLIQDQGQALEEKRRLFAQEQSKNQYLIQQLKGENNTTEKKKYYQLIQNVKKTIQQKEKQFRKIVKHQNPTVRKLEEENETLRQLTLKALNMKTKEEFLLQQVQIKKFLAGDILEKQELQNEVMQAKRMYSQLQITNRKLKHQLEKIQSIENYEQSPYQLPFQQNKVIKNNEYFNVAQQKSVLFQINSKQFNNMNQKIQYKKNNKLAQCKMLLQKIKRL